MNDSVRRHRQVQSQPNSRVPLAGTLELGCDILPLPDKISTNTLHTLAYRF